MSAVGAGVGPESKGPHTGVCVYAGRDLARANPVKKGDILAKDGLEVAFANSLCGHLGSVGPDKHVDVCADKHTHTCNLRGEDDSWFKTTSLKEEFTHPYTPDRTRP